MMNSNLLPNNYITARSWSSTSSSGKVLDNSNESPLYSGSSEENLSREEIVEQLKNFAKKSGYSKDVVKLVLQELDQSLSLPSIDAFLKKLIENAKDLEVSSGKMHRISLEEIAQQFNSSEKVDKNQNVKLKYKHIVIDGSNLAMSHGGKKIFSCRGIQVCVQYFLNRGHREITAFVPEWRKEAPKPDAPICEQEILTQLESQGFLVFTPSRRVRGKRRAHHDDYFVVKLAAEKDGIIVSNDNFRDIQHESPKWRKVIEKQLLMYSFVGDTFMPVEDPLGRHGPTLDMFLCSGVESDTEATICPYGRRCTYGNKCKYVHPEKLREDHSESLMKPPVNPMMNDGSIATKSNMDMFAGTSNWIVAREFGPSPVSRGPKFNGGWDYKDTNNHFSSYDSRREDYGRQNIDYSSYRTGPDSHRMQHGRNDYDTRMYPNGNTSSGMYAHNSNTEVQSRGWSRGDQAMESGRSINDFRMQSHPLPLESRLQTLSIDNEQSFDHRGSRAYNNNNNQPTINRIQPIQRPQARPPQRGRPDMSNWPAPCAPPRQHGATYFDRAV